MGHSSVGSGMGQARGIVYVLGVLSSNAGLMSGGYREDNFIVGGSETFRRVGLKALLLRPREWIHGQEYHSGIDENGFSNFSYL